MNEGKGMRNICLYDQLAREPGWTELHALLVERYKQAKELKVEPYDEFWAVWSGEFNRYGRSIYEEEIKDNSPYKMLFAMWSTMTRLLGIYSQLKASGRETKRKKLRKLEVENRILYKKQKEKFLHDIKTSEQG